MFSSNTSENILLMLKSQTDRFNQMWRPSEQDRFYLDQMASPAYAKARTKRAKDPAAFVVNNANNNNGKGLLAKQIQQINAICGVGDSRKKKGPAKVAPKAAVLEKQSFDHVYETYRIKGGNGPEWSNYRRGEYKIDDSDVKNTLASPAFPHKQLNRFRVSAEMFRLCDKLAAADFTTKNDDINDLCDMLENMKI